MATPTRKPTSSNSSDQWGVDVRHVSIPPPPCTLHRDHSLSLSIHVARLSVWLIALFQYGHTCSYNVHTASSSKGW